MGRCSLGALPVNQLFGRGGPRCVQRAARRFRRHWLARQPALRETYVCFTEAGCQRKYAGSMSTDRFGEVLGDKRGADPVDTAEYDEFNPSPLTRARMFVMAINEQPERQMTRCGFCEMTRTISSASPSATCC